MKGKALDVRAARGVVAAIERRPPPFAHPGNVKVIEGREPVVMFLDYTGHEASAGKERGIELGPSACLPHGFAMPPLCFHGLKLGGCASCTERKTL